MTQLYSGSSGRTLRVTAAAVPASSSSARGVTNPSAGQSSSSSSGRQFRPEVGLDKPSCACPPWVGLQAGPTGGRGHVQRPCFVPTLCCSKASVPQPAQTLCSPFLPSLHPNLTATLIVSAAPPSSTFAACLPVLRRLADSLLTLSSPSQAAQAANHCYAHSLAPPLTRHGVTALQVAYFTSSSSGVSRNAAQQALSSRTTHNSSGSTAVMAGVEGVVVTPVLPNAYPGMAGQGQPPTTSSGSSQVGILP